METTRDRYGVTTPVTWVGELASSAVEYAQQAAAWAWDGAWGVAEWASSPVRQVATTVAGEIGETLKGHPYIAGVLAGAAGLGAAMALGLGELAAGVAIGYGTYLVLAKGERPMQAIGEALALERGAEPALVPAPAKRIGRTRARATAPRAAGKKAPPRRRGR